MNHTRHDLSLEKHVMQQTGQLSSAGFSEAIHLYIQQSEFGFQSPAQLAGALIVYPSNKCFKFVEI